MNINFFMAMFWIVLGLGLVVYHTIFPDTKTLRLNFINMSPGWLIMALAVWNLVRWWNAVSAEKDRLIQEEQLFQRQKKRYDTLNTKEVVNPEFDFSKPLPKTDEAITKNPSPKNYDTLKTREVEEPNPELDFSKPEPKAEDHIKKEPPANGV